MNSDTKRTRRVLEPVSVTRDTERDIPTVRLTPTQINALVREKPAMQWQLFAIGMTIALVIGFLLGLEKVPPPLPPPVKYTARPGEKLVAVDIPLPMASAPSEKRLLRKPKTDTKRPLFRVDLDPYKEM